MFRTTIIVLFGCLQLNSWAQSCIPDYIYFTLQSQVDSFQINYPGCTEIEGDVTIRGTDITNLNGLLVLTSIGGSLRIDNTTALTSLYGMNNLSTVGEDLNIEENEALLNLVGLNGLISISGSLTILENTNLLHLIGLDNLTSIGDDLNIGCSNYSWTGNPLLTNLSGLGSLSSIGDYLKICSNHGLTDLTGIENITNVDNIRISSNNNLSSLTGLQGVTNVNGYLSISWCDSLNSLYGLNNLTTVGSLSLHRLPNLDDVSGLEQLCTVDNDLQISDNFSINSIAALASLTYIGGKLTIENNDDLYDLSGLENLTEIGASLEINANSSLSNINALSSVTSIGGDLIIRSGDLTSLGALSGVSSIDGNLVISNIYSLTSLSGIENINPSSIESLEISYLMSLTDCALSNICEYLSNPNGAVDIYRNEYPCNSPVQIANECGITIPCLPYGNYYFLNQSDIDNFQINYPGCTDLGGSVHVWGGDSGGSGAITNLFGLSVITSINGILSVIAAYYLPSLSGIDNIEVDSITDLHIRNNTLLSECEVQSICDYLTSPNGETYIYSNAIGCNSPEEILSACETIFIDEDDTEQVIIIFPSPTNQYLHIENRGNIEIHKILISNAIGQVIISQNYNDPLINVTDLNHGVYILEIVGDNFRDQIKFIIDD